MHSCLGPQKALELGRPDGNRGVKHCAVLQGRREFLEKKSWYSSWNKGEGAILMRAEGLLLGAGG